MNCRLLALHTTVNYQHASIGPHGRPDGVCSSSNLNQWTASKPFSVTDLLPVDTKENPYFYTFKVQCTSCRETHPNLVSVSRFVSRRRHALLIAPSLPKTGRGRNQMRCPAVGVKPTLCGSANPAGCVFVSLIRAPFPF